jgi:class 3 adenylate cyclase
MPGAHVERRTVAVLFCDLVGFSELAYQRDAEDVQHLLVEYLAIVRDRLESHGGVIEKYIGDAVLAVFGFDEAHDDDTERALHAALSILTELAEYNAAADPGLHVHIGVHVGEVVADLRANPASGRGFVAGQVVNLAQRLQSLAPPDTVVVSREVVERARAGFTFFPRPPQEAKGYPGRLENWQVQGTRRAIPPGVLPLVGRADELAVLLDRLHAVVATSESTVVVISGEAGLGKSRLLVEFEAAVKGMAFRVTWLKGRCLPYGSGVTFSALAEILKQATGVLDSDDSSTARSKVEAALSDEPDGPWLADQLLTLLGAVTTAADRDELFGAWTKALLALSRGVPTVLVVEDLHWADDGLLSFLKVLAHSALPGKLLVVLTTRNGPLSGDRSWPGQGATRLRLRGLDAVETQRIVAAELGANDQLLPEEVRRLLLERAAGNPLFAREFARLLRDAQRLGGDERLTVDALPVPTSIQALLAARLDTLSLFERAIVQCASLIGKVFWAGAVTSLGDFGEAEVRRALDALCDHGIVRRREVSVLAGDSEYSFSHALLRDVAYERAPRVWRRDAHLAAIAWIESMAGSRLDEVAEVLVHHATAAYEFALLTHTPDVAEDARQLVCRYAMVAARRAAMLDAGQALVLLDQAVEFSRPDDRDQAEILLAWAGAAFAVNRVAEATQVRLRVVQGLRATADDPLLLAAALMDLSDGYYQLGELEEALAADREAAQIGRSLPPKSDAGDPVANLALTLAAVGDLEGLTVAEEAERRAAVVGLPIPLLALRARGILRLQSGDPAGLTDLEEAVRRVVEERWHSRTVASAMSDRADAVWMVQGSDAGVAAYSQAVDFAASRGLVNIAQWNMANRLRPMLEAGSAADVLDQAQRLWPVLSDSRIGCTTLSVLVAAAGELDDVPCLQRYQEATRDAAATALKQAYVDPESVMYASCSAIRSSLLLGDSEVASDLLVRTGQVTPARFTTSYAQYLVDYVRFALVCGLDDLAVTLATTDHADRTLRGLAQETAASWLQLYRGHPAEAAAGLASAALRWWDVGNRLEHSYCLVGVAVAAQALGEDATSARASAEQARAALGLPWPRAVPMPR